MKEYAALHLIYLLTSFVCSGVVLLVMRHMVNDVVGMVACVVTFNVVFTISTVATVVLAVLTPR